MGGERVAGGQRGGNGGTMGGGQRGAGFSAMQRGGSGPPAQHCAPYGPIPVSGAVWLWGGHEWGPPPIPAARVTTATTDAGGPEVPRGDGGWGAAMGRDGGPGARSSLPHIAGGGRRDPNAGGPQQHQWGGGEAAPTPMGTWPHRDPQPAVGRRAAALQSRPAPHIPHWPRDPPLPPHSAELSAAALSAPHGGSQTPPVPNPPGSQR